MTLTLIEFPRSVGISVGERGTLGFLLQSQMLELAFTGLQSVGNFTQRPRLSELAEEHRHKLLPGSESPGVSFGLELTHMPRKS